MRLIVPSRRSFLGGLAAVISAPAVVRASSLMPVRSIFVPRFPTLEEVVARFPPTPPWWYAETAEDGKLFELMAQRYANILIYGNANGECASNFRELEVYERS